MKTTNVKMILETALKILCLLFVAAYFSACNDEGSGGSGSGASPAAGFAPQPGASGGDSQPPQDQSVLSLTITVKSGYNFDCFVLNQSTLGKGQVWCRAQALTGAFVNFGSTTYAKVVEKTGDITSISTWNNTLCVFAYVSEQPVSRAEGPAFYCYGDPNISSSYQNYNVTTTQPALSPELTFAAAQPTYQGDYGQLWLWQQTIIQDGQSMTSSQNLTCSLSASTLTCPDFTISL